jgi:hypothetical protein
METEYDLSGMQSRSNPYAAKLNQPVTVSLGDDVIDYFKQMAQAAGVPYQSLINLYLRDCVAPDQVEQAWAAEVARRVAAIERGEMQMLPLEQVLAEIRASLK